MPSAQKVFFPFLERAISGAGRPDTGETVCQSRLSWPSYKDALARASSESATATASPPADRVPSRTVGRRGTGHPLSVTVKVRMDLADFDFPLPEELIAQEPLPDRAASRMLVVYRAGGPLGRPPVSRVSRNSWAPAIAWCSTIRAFFRRACSAIARACARCPSAGTIPSGTNI